MKEEKKRKKLLSILLALVLLASALAAVAEEKRQAPADKKTITTELNESATSVFHMYDGKFYDEPFVYHERSLEGNRRIVLADRRNEIARH